MGRKEIEQRVKDILADKMDVDARQITPEARLVDDLGMDSLAAIEVVFALKEAFQIDIQQESLENDMQNMTLVRDIIEYIRDRVRE